MRRRRPWGSLEGAVAGAFVALALLAPGPARAQNISLPGPHFGATMFPDLDPVQHIGLQFYDFTEFDKVQDATGQYRRYNDLTQTIGFNLLTLSNTRSLRREDLFSSNLLLRSSWVIGWSADQPTRFLQNDVIHEIGNLPKVPRGDTSTRPLLNYAAELNYNFHAIGRSDDGRLQFVPTPLFVGAGYSAGTIMQDLYIQGGIHQLSSARVIPCLEPYFFFSVSAMMRAGVTLPGYVIRDTQLAYGLAQGALRIHIATFSFPIVAEVALTGSTGVFRRGVGPQYGPYVMPAGDPPPRVDRVALPEYFVAFRLQLGDFVFETVNDFYGDKDRGPTYGASVYWVLLPGTWLSRQVGRL